MTPQRNENRIETITRDNSQPRVITTNLIFILIAVGFGTSFQYYSNSVINNIVSLGQSWFNDSYIDHYDQNLTKFELNFLWSFSSASFQIGAIFGSMLVHFVAERLGRRKSLIITGCSSSLGTTIVVFAYFANFFQIFVFGRFVIGVSVGTGTGILTMFINEIAPIRFRGACGSVQQLFIGFGNLLSLVLTLPQIWGTKFFWIAAVGVPIIAGLLQAIVLTLTHDTPRYLILTKKDMINGVKAIKFYRGVAFVDSTLKSIDQEILDHETNCHRPMKLSVLWTDRRLRKPMFISLSIVFGVQLSGIGPVMAYSKQMFTDAGLDDMTAKVATVGVGCCTFLSPFFTTFLVEKSGRKKIYLGGLTTCFIALCAFITCAELSYQFDYHASKMATIPCMYIYQIGFALASSIAWIVPAELFPQWARSHAVMVITFVMWSLQALTVVAYLPFKDTVGVSISFLPFLICIGSTIVFCTCYMPETKGKSVDLIAKMFDSDLARANEEDEPLKSL